MEIDIIRHITTFNPHEFGERRVDVIGCGATGSRIAMELAKLGIQNLHIWDFDSIESHNPANQLFYNEDIGKLKVDAIADHIFRATGTMPFIHNERVDGSQELGEIVFLLTDTMSSRKEIWDETIANNPMVELMIETRMGADMGKIYTINPNNFDHIKLWEGTLCDDAVAAASVCGGKISVGPTAKIIAGSAVWQLINWFDHIKQPDELDWPSKQLFLNFRPFSMITDVDLE